MAKAQRQQRRAQRQENKSNRIEARGQKKAIKAEGKVAKAQRQEARKMARQDVKDTRVLTRQERQNKRVARQQGKQEVIGARFAEKTERGRIRTEQKRAAMEAAKPRVEVTPETALAETVGNVLSRGDEYGGEAYGTRQEVYENYLMENGYSPEEIAEDPYLLAAQFKNVYDEEVEYIQEEEGYPTYEEAEEMYLSDDDMFDSFDPVTLGFIAAAGDVAVKEIGKKRAKSGKKTLGKMYDPKTGKVVEEEPTAEEKESAKFIIKKAVSAGVERVKKDETDKTVNEYMPYIAVAVISLLLIGAAVATAK